MARRSLVFVSALVAATVALTGCASHSTTTNGALFSLGANGGEKAGMPASDAAMWWPPYEYVYVAGEGLSLDGQPSRIYRVEPAGDPEKVAAKVAKAFGLTGEVKRVEESWPMPMPLPAADGSTVTTEEPQSDVQTTVYYVVGSQDWTGPSLNLYWNSNGSWYYNNPAAYGSTSVGCAIPEPTTDDATKPDRSVEAPEDCVYEPSLPKNLPSVEDARAQAVALFTATGLTVTTADVNVRADEWGVFANAAMKVDGQPVGIEWSMSWGDGGVISSASGYAAKIVEAGVFDTISDRKAVARVGDWRWYGGAASMWYPMPDMRVAVSEPMPADGQVSSGGGASSPGFDPGTSEPVPTDSPSVIAPMPVEPMPVEPPKREKVTVILDKSERALLTVFDSSGRMWLVPGYVFTDASGGVYPIVSVVEGVIEMPDAGLMMVK